MRQLRHCETNFLIGWVEFRELLLNLFLKSIPTSRQDELKFISG